MLTLKSAIATSADSVTIKGIKFIVGNAIPIVGSSLSDALNTIISSISLLKTTVGMLAVLILIFINLPTLIELFLWFISLKILNLCCGIIGQDSECNFIEAFEGLLTILIAVVVYQGFLYIISVSLLTVISGMR